ncbi:hypothetical protein [Streptomyces alkaliterrae]|uniref:Uncharacterized protein n=1 Tax=Streptomyces alkaliterrae TaxID=2213162 RepID=A0A7W3ZRL8_9ACTN|nr:hypothetical protein [Streptomyces alkaliterrae]MBB1251774.1 hypothetical protein [Streptomyces alkaliterrae]MBB1257787.1 hypothetical protein [Streptomyces alkaliterrae]
MNGKESEKPWDPGEFRTAHALRDRGLLTITRSGGEVDAQVTEASAYYVQHGHHADNPAHAGEKQAARSHPLHADNTLVAVRRAA